MPLCRNATTSPVRASKLNLPGTISQELEKAGRLFVLGIGNKHKGDDAAGSLCIRLLKKRIIQRKSRADLGSAEAARPGLSKRTTSHLAVRLLDAGETPEAATGLIREFRPTHVLIVDAAAGGHEPGTIFVIDKEKISQNDISTHRLPLFYLVRYLEEGIGCRVILVGIEPKEIAWGKPVTLAVGRAAARLAAYLGEILTARRF